MVRLISLIIVFILGGVVIPGCHLNDCICPDIGTIDKYADVVGLGSDISKKATETTGLGSINANDKVNWDQIAFFTVRYGVRTYGYHLPRTTPSYNWGSAAFACSCVQPGYLGSDEKLTRLSVKTVFDFNQNYSKGSVIDDLVLLNYNGNISLKNYLLLKAPVPYNYSTTLDFTIAKSPSAKGPFALDITVELDNGEVYTSRTPIIQLQ